MQRFIRQSVRTAVALSLVLALSHCSWKLDRPRSGIYRAVLELPGGELPFQLEIDAETGGIQLWMLTAAGKQPTTAVSVQDGRLSAELPQGSGKLTASMHRSGLDGELVLPAETLPFRAAYGADYRFFAESATDNADVSGRWRLTCNSGALGVLSADLQQSHDQVDGGLQSANGGEWIVQGQVRNDEVFLGALGAGHALLYKARVTPRGELQGELWDGMKSQQSCTAQREKPEESVQLE